MNKKLMIPIAVVCFTISLIVGLYFGGVFDSSDGSGSGTKTGTGSGSLSTTPSTSRSSPDPAIAAAIAERIRNGGNNTGSTTQPNTDCKPFQNTGTSLMSYLSSLTSSNGVKTSDIHKKPDSTSTGLQCDEAIYKLNSDTSDYFYAYDKINDKVVIVDKNDPALISLNSDKTISNSDNSHTDNLGTSVNYIHYQSPLTRNAIKGKYANATFYDGTQNISDCVVYRPNMTWDNMWYVDWEVYEDPQLHIKKDKVYRIGGKGGKTCPKLMKQRYNQGLGGGGLYQFNAYDKTDHEVVELAHWPNKNRTDADPERNLYESQADKDSISNAYSSLGLGTLDWDTTSNGRNYYYTSPWNTPCTAASKITSEDECKSAIEALNLPMENAEAPWWTGSVDNHLIGGCSYGINNNTMINGRGLFNTNLTNEGVREDHAPICKI